MICGGPPPDDGVMNRFLAISYGAFSYVLFLVVFVYAILFVGGIAVPRSVDNAVSASPLLAVAIDLVLLTLFALQHSVMARPAFKRWWTRYVPTAIERSTYVLAGESGSGPAALAVAVDSRRGLGGVVNPGAAGGVGAVLARLGHRAWRRRS